MEMRLLKRDDPEIYRLVKLEEERVSSTIDLIAAENHPPLSILEAQGSVFGGKTAEGFPGHRFHAGCEWVDEMEGLAKERGKRLFGADHVNVQPHSGVAANLAVFFSVLEVGDKVLSMKLSHGGHLSHGDPASMTSKCFEFKHYSVDPETECIDYNEVRDLALRFRPRMIVAGASSYSRLIDYETMADIAKEASAYLLADMAHIAGLVAARVIPSPVPFCDFVTFTTYKTLAGGRGGVILCREPYAGDIDRAVFPGGQGTPALNQVAAKAVCFKLAMSPGFTAYQKKVLSNARRFAEAFEKLGYRLVSGGTDNHLVLIDLRSKGLNGKEAEALLESVGIILNRNVIPGDTEKPSKTGGIRVGASAITTRGMGPAEVERIAAMMDTAMIHRNDSGTLSMMADEVSELCRQFPLA
jgi:glycine hydroxymethyltransferase